MSVWRYLLWDLETPFIHDNVKRLKEKVKLWKLWSLFLEENSENFSVWFAFGFSDWAMPWNWFWFSLMLQNVHFVR